MKKKIVLILSLLALMVCLLAVSVSASTYLDFSGVELDPDVYCYINVYGNVEDGFTSNIEEYFGIVKYSDNQDNNAYGFVNIEWWHSYLKDKNIVDANEFSNLILSMAEEGMIPNTDSNDIGYYACFDADRYFSVYQKYVASLKTYDEGVEDGKVLGAELGYDSGYSAGETDGYKTGYNAGKIAYKNSNEFDVEIQSSYNDGYDDGYEEAISEAGNVVSVIVPVVIIVGLIGIAAMIANAMHRKNRRKR